MVKIKSNAFFLLTYVKRQENDILKIRLIFASFPLFFYTTHVEIIKTIRKTVWHFPLKRKQCNYCNWQVFRHASVKLLSVIHP